MYIGYVQEQPLCMCILFLICHLFARERDADKRLHWRRFFFVLFIIGRISPWFRLIYTCGSGFLDDVVCVLVWLVQPGGHGDGRGECWGSSRHVVTKRERATNIRTTRRESARERERKRDCKRQRLYCYILAHRPPPSPHTHTHAAVWSI